ncbi:MAG TPA: hypothetical protein DIU25_06980, partial [Ruminococcaceae bacterium]|nr:hypothetical protein [Oscillospiraceae bacterium]
MCGPRRCAGCRPCCPARRWPSIPPDGPHRQKCSAQTKGECPVKKQRLFYLDLIRAVALVCILVIHFNAAVTGYFTLPSKLFGSVLPFNIYLGDFGSSLFFMVSGAALQYTSPG